MSARSYLSIGDVLTLLRQEFPDVTISKIRFLESQGLVNPERTPSGYRKFYEHDVERLRWVLRQQREHFLPLKVIKDRLDEDASSGSPSPASSAGPRRAAVAAAAPDPQEEVEVAPEPTTPSRPSVAVATTGAGAGESDDQVASDPLPAAPARERAVPLRVVAAEPEPAPAESAAPGYAEAGAAQAAGAEAAVAEAEAAEAEAAEAEAAEAEAAEAQVGVPEPVLVGHLASPGAGSLGSDPGRSARPGTDPVGTRGAPSTAPAARTANATTPDPPVERAHHAALATSHTVGADVAPPANGTGNGSTGRSAAKASSERAPRTAKGASTPAPQHVRGAVSGPDDARVTGTAGSGGASLSLDELASASGLTDDYIRQLEEYGLVRPTTIGGAPYYDEEALTVATVAAKFAAFGIEARHLRLYKNAADREAGFIEQIVIPMVRQRNPEARARATQTADDLAVLGQQLRGSLLRTALRELLNG